MHNTLPPKGMFSESTWPLYILGNEW